MQINNENSLCLSRDAIVMDRGHSLLNQIPSVDPARVPAYYSLEVENDSFRLGCFGTRYLISRSNMSHSTYTRTVTSLPTPHILLY